MSTAKKAVLAVVERADLKSGMQVRVHQIIKETNDKGEEKQRTQVFEGLIIARRHGNELGATFTVRKVSEGVGVEKTYPVHSPLIEKIELTDMKKTRRAKLYYVANYAKRLRSTSEKKAVKKSA